MSEKVVIIGAGPTGLLLAHYLLRRENYYVEIYERRHDPRQTNFEVERTFPINLQERGRKALREIEGLEGAITQESVWITGTTSYSQKSRRIPRKQPLICLDRNQLVKIILQHLEKIDHGSRLKLNFNAKLIAIDDTTNSATLESKNEEILTVNYDRIVAADGARSQIRQYLVEKKGLQSEESYVPDAYKSVFFQQPSNPDLQLDRDTIHAQTLKDRTRMLLVPQPQEQLNGVIVFDANKNPFENFSSKADVIDFMKKNFPFFNPCMSEEEAEALLERRLGRVLTVRCDRFHEGGKILMLGDAAHAVSPSIGQGCNAGLEDVLIFNQLLDQYQDNWEQALPAFSENRVPDAHALKELSDYALPRRKILVAELFLRLKIKRFLNRLFPNLFKPFVFDLLLDSNVPYREVLQANQGWINRLKKADS